MPMKTGANFQDQNKIKAMEAQGHDSESISRALSIEERIVRNFMENPGGQSHEGLPDGFMFDGDGNITDAQGNIYEVDEHDELVPVE